MDDAKVVASNWPRDDIPELPANWESMPHVEATTARDLHEALDRGMARDADEELGWRYQLWWAYNADLHRKVLPRNSQSHFLRPGAARSALIGLLVLTPETDTNSQMARVEILRELGLFKRAMEELSRVPTGSPYLERNKALLRQLIINRDPLVRLMDDGKVTSSHP